MNIRPWRSWLCLLTVPPLALFSVSSRAANMSPLTLTGFNRDLVIENTAAGPPYSSYASQLNPGEGLAFYQSGLPGKTLGLPVSGNFTSAMGDGTVFQFEPYTANNALVLSSDTGLTSGTLTLSSPGIFARIAILANSASGGGSPTLTLNFSDGSTFVTNYDAPDWFNNTGFALQGTERISLSNGSTSGGNTNPRFYQKTIDLVAALGGANKVLVSLTFAKASAGSTAIYAISGESSGPAPALILSDPVNATVNENAPASFTAGVAGNPYPTLQWYKNSTLLPGATTATYSIASAPLSDNNASFRLVASNFTSSSTVVTSAPAVLTVIADTNRPVLLGAQTLSLTQVLARITERLTPQTATNTSNYVISGTNGPVSVSSATVDSSQTNVILTVGSLTDGASYTLTVNNLRDLSAAGNIIATNSQATFIASIYVFANLGNPTPAGSQVPVANGLNVSAGGSDLGRTSDQGQFSYLSTTGDFDVRVRLDSISLADAWSEAGLLAREDALPGGRSAGVFATPSISGCYFQTRGSTNGGTALSGSFPVSYPNMWLRLKRVGNAFTGFAGYDGQSWTQLGASTVTMPATIFLGFAVSSHNTNQLTTAKFRDFSNVTGPVAAGLPAIEPLGQASRLTSLVISEIMYHPTNAALEYVEIFNSRGEPQDLSGYRLGGDIDYVFPPGTSIAGGGFLVVAQSPTAMQTNYNLSNVLGPFTNNLPNSAGSVKLFNQAGALFLEVDYSDEPPWPAAADGAGHSLVLARPSFGQNNVKAWAASDAMGGSPGAIEPYNPDALRKVVINEFLAHTDLPSVDYIELYNHSAQPVDISGCILTDDAATNKFIIPPGTVLPVHGFVSYTETTMNFALNAAGETIYFKNPSNTRVLDAVRFDAQENGISTGRSPDGAEQFYRLSAKTPGTPNAPFLVEQVVINELMYHPISGDPNDQYVELFNSGGSSVDLSGWSFTKGISFTFPTNTLLAPNSYLVVAKSAAHLITNYSTLNVGNTLGDFSGKLSGSTDRLVLTKPDTITSTNGSVVTTNLIHIPVSEVIYQSAGRWPELADGGGSSLELIDPRADTRAAANWAASDETTKAPWTQISASGTVDNTSSTADQLQILLLGPGECLVDSVQVSTPTNANLITNGTFEVDASGWTAEGTESLSSLETTEGFLGGRSYHVRALERGDNEVNRIRTPLSSSIPSGTTNVTIQANVRWLKGDRNILLRLRGNGLECSAVMAPPVNAGTPGAANSRAVNNAGPAISAVQHAPVLPAVSEPIVVTAKVQDPQGVSSVSLNYRLDPAASYATVTMNDSGTNGDAVAGDGIYSATIPGQAAGMIAFYVQATDLFSPAATTFFPNNAPMRECLVRVGETQPTGNFPVYRIWMTQNTLNTWTSRKKLDNTPLDITFVLGNQRAIYNTIALYAGSPYISPGYSAPNSGRCGYSISVPGDDLFLGETDIVLDWPGGHGNETSAMQEQMGYWIADRLNLPYSHRYTIRLHVNGVTDEARSATFEAVQQPSSGFVKAWSPLDTSGKFYKIERAFEFNDGGGLMADPEPQLQNFTTTGGLKKREKYRWFFPPRAGTEPNDFTNIFALADALNGAAPEPYTSATFGLIDVEEWMRIFATEHIIENFDAYGHEIGKNMYAYQPSQGKWQLYMFDLDWLMLAANNHGYSASSAPLFNADDPTIVRMYAFPPFARAYWRAVQDAANGPMLAANSNPVMDAKYKSLVDNGIVWCDGQALTPPTTVKTWFSQRLGFLQSQLATVTPAFAVNPSITISNGLGLVTGTAPVGVNTVSINGSLWNVTWTTVTNWAAWVPLVFGSNGFSVVALDRAGQTINGTSNFVSVTSGTTVQSPVGKVIINEIMANPRVPDAEYIELFNSATNYAFDLSGWTFNGLSYTFPNGASIGPRGYLLLTKDREAFTTAYGGAIQVFDQYAGNLQSGGETLSLIKPGTNAASDLIVTRVRYSDTTPWPPSAAPLGSSLQLVDAAQDNWRVGNWNSLPQWVYVTTTGPATSSTLYIYLQSAGDVYVDDIKLVAGSVPEAGTNILSKGDFESSFPGTAWHVSSNLAASAPDVNVKHSGNASLHVISTAAGSSQSTAIWQTTPAPVVTNATYTLSFWYLQSTNGGPLTIRLSGSGLGTNVNPAPPGPSTAMFTPGATNNVVASLPTFPALWINELQAENQTGITNSAGQRVPWLEIYNPSSNGISMSGLYLANNYSNLFQWQFPGAAVINPGQYKIIFADGLTNLTTATEWHANFTLPAGAGALALSRSFNGQPQVLDYVDYAGLRPGRSFGSYPDGQSFTRQEFFYTTAGGANNATSAPINILINEWMADNTHTITDPADNAFDDWFELYNPTAADVDLGGYYLTDTLTNKFQFQVPATGQYKVPAHGYLLVWADNETGQNNTNRADLHANFKLSKTGEAIGLFAGDGSAIDTVSFGPQTSDVSEGRYPDAAGGIYTMTVPTPRAANYIPNTAPVLAPITNRVATLGQTLSFAVSATDTDQPPQSLTFTLLAGAPNGAFIDPSSGVFSWTPSAAPTTNSISIRVADNGSPSLSATQSFTVFVVSSPQVTNVRLSGNQFVFSWAAPSGQTCQVEFRDDLLSGSWTALGSPFTGTGSTISVTNVISASQQRFFRLRVLP